MWIQLRGNIVRLVRERAPSVLDGWVEKIGAPYPVSGDIYDFETGTFSMPAPVEKVFIIDVKDFFVRMTDAEQDALFDSTNAQVIKFVRRCKNVGVIRGTAAELKTLAQGLNALGILTVARAREIFKEVAIDN